MDFKFPDVGEGITEGVVVKWLVEEGDKIMEDQNIVEIETDKAIVQIPSPRAGIILKINFKAGETVKVGDVLVSIDDGEKLNIKKERANFSKIEEKYKSSSVVGVLEEAKEVMKVQPEAIEKKVDSKKILATPSIRRLAKENGIDLNTIKGSGAGGRIVKEDLSKDEIKKNNVKVAKKYDIYGYVERIPLSGIRKTISNNMVIAASAPLVTSMDEADIKSLVEVRNKEKIAAEEKGIKLTYLPFFVKALIAALKEHSVMNSSLVDNEIVIKKYYNIGIAVDSENGLIVPVIKGANNKSIIEIAKEIFELAEKVRSRKINLGELQGGTFTITNYGSLRGSYATPIINLGEAAILGVGRMFDKPVLVKDEWQVRKVLPMSLTFDHRILDGAKAARFMDSLIKHLEDPSLLLIDE